MKSNSGEVVKLLKLNTLSSYKIAQETGISDQTIQNYREGKTKPSGANLTILTKYLGIAEIEMTIKSPSELSVYPKNKNINIANEPCSNCAVLQAEINRLNKALVASKEETIAALRGDKKIPQVNCG